MALKLPDSAVPMGDFPVAKAVDIDFNDGENLQEKLDNGKLGGDNSTHKTVIFENQIDMGKYILLAKITDANYSNNIIKFSCPNYKGSMDVGFKYEDDMDIYKFELHFNTGSMRETSSYGVTLKQHGLVLYSYPLSNPKNTEPKLEEAVRLYWDYSKGEIYVFLVDIMTAIPHCVLEYTGSGTLIRNNTFVMDGLYNRREGLNGTWEDSKWKSIPYNKLETPPIYELGGGSAEGATTYTSLDALGLTAPVSVGEIFNAMSDNTMAILACEAKDETDGTVNISGIPMSFGVLTIKKNEKGRFSIEYQNSLQSSPCNVRKWIGTLKGLDGTGLIWKEIYTDETRVTTLETQVSELFQSVSSGKTLVANAITGKGVSTATNATFATMATNISKISAYKEERKTQYVPMPNATTMVVRFSANVLGITEVIPPSDDSYITSEEMIRIEGGDVYVRVSGEGTWAITALVEQ